MSKVTGINPTFSKGCGGATGVQARTDMCAVEGCENQGRAQVCPYDGRHHGHGAIHYKNDENTSLIFRQEPGWFWMCNEHYAHILQECALREDARRESQA